MEDKKKKRRWTEEEDAILAKNVRENYDNLVVAFKKTSYEINRTPQSCSYRWYNCFNGNRRLMKKHNICFATLSDRKAMVNRKSLPLNYAKDYTIINNGHTNTFKMLMNKIRKLFI